MIIRATLLLGNNEYSEIVREIVEYVVRHINKNSKYYELNVDLRTEDIDNSDRPVLIIEDFEPIIIDKIPSIETLFNVFMAAGDAKYLSLIDNEFIPVNNEIF